MSRVRRIAKLSVLAGGTLSSNRLEINRRKDGVLGLDTPGGSFLEQRYRGLTAARAMKDVNIQVRHDSSPVVEESICLARKEACDGNRHSARLESRHGRISLPVSVTAPQSTAIRTAKLVAPITHAIHAPTWTGRASQVSKIFATSLLPHAFSTPGFQTRRAVNIVLSSGLGKATVTSSQSSDGVPASHWRGEATQTSTAS